MQLHGKLSLWEILSVLGMMLVLTAPVADARDRPPFAEIVAALEQWDKQPPEITTLPSGSALHRKTEACLALAAGCEWQTASRDLRETWRKHPDRAHFNTVEFYALLLAVEFVNAQPVQDIEELFGANTRRLDRKTGRLRLRYDNPAQKATELLGRREGGGGAISLSRGNVVRLDVPFLKYGTSVPAAKIPKKPTEAKFACRLMGMQNGDAFTISAEVTEAETDAVRPFLTLGKKDDGKPWAIVDVETKANRAARRRVTQRKLPKDTFSTWRTISAVIGRHKAEFGIEGKFEKAIRCPSTGTVYFEVKADGQNVSLDWMEFEGLVDGFWLARRTVLGRRQSTEEFYTKMDLP